MIELNLKNQKYMKKLLVYSVMAMMAVVIPMMVSASFTSPNVTEEKQSIIQSIMAQIKALQAQLVVIQGGTNCANSCYDFKSNMKIGDQNDGVSVLLNDLVTNGVATERSTNFSNTFDETMASYVTGFQEKYASEILTPANLTHGTGFLGARTRAKLNALYGCNKVNTDLVPPPLSPIVCTMEARQCSDGKTYVSRTGPRCEFSTCPTSSLLDTSTQVISPNGGEQFSLGSSVMITWKPLQYAPSSIGRVIISLVDADGYSNERRLGDAGLNETSFVWNIPNCTATNPCSSNFQISTGKYKIKVYGLTTSDTSDNAFTIIDPNITIQTASNAPVIFKFSQTGSTVAIGGSGFNSVYGFDPSSQNGIWISNPQYSARLQMTSSSKDGTYIEATIPNSYCPGIEAIACSSNFSKTLLPGDYSLYIKSNNGVSNIVSLRISYLSVFDYNSDGVIDKNDLMVLTSVSNNLQSCPTGKMCDVNSDGIVNISDLTKFASMYNISTSGN